MKRLRILIRFIVVICFLLTPAAVAAGSVGGSPDWSDVSMTTKTLKPIGRAVFEQESITLEWGMTGFEFAFKGTAARVMLTSDDRDDTYCTHVAVYVNGKRTEKIRVKNGSDWYTLAEGLDATASTTIRVVKLNEAMLSTCWVDGLQIDGTLLPRPADKPLKMEVIGDSISAAFGLLSPTLTSEGEDAAYTYGSLIAEQLDMDLSTVAASGYGVYMNNGGTTGEVMTHLYDMAQPVLNKRVQWDHNSFHPDLILVGLGTNDMAANAPADQVAAAVRAFIRRLKALHPDAQILWVFGLMGVGGLSDPIREAVQAEDDGSGTIRYEELPNQTTYGGGTGAAGHPNRRSHYRTMEYLLPIVREMLGVSDQSNTTTATTTTTTTTVSHTTRETAAATTTDEGGTTTTAAEEGGTTATADDADVTTTADRDSATNTTVGTTPTAAAPTVTDTPSGGSLGWLAAVIAAAGLLLAGGAAWLIWRNKKKE